ncbi:MAG: FG-GAP-like repeat-containing protein, partial [Ferruginibacter sp.]
KMKGYYNGAAYADLDNDGNLDLVINPLNAKAVILKNNAPKQNSIAISFKSDSGNTFGIGAKAYLFQKDKIQYQELMLTRGFESSSDTRLHFGLGTDSLIDSILVVWPNQKKQVIKNIIANKPLVFEAKNATDNFNYNAPFKPVAPVLTDISAQVGLAWQHKENDFVDFNYQYLIPHAESTRGPKIAVADVNGDGLDDFYVCGALNQAGALMIQQKNGGFIEQDKDLFEKDKGTEGVDALFFDANGDGKPDLWVVAGGNQSPQNSSMLADKLYLNNGNGHFSKKESFMTPMLETKSCITVADVDHDGDMDVFIGTLCTPKIYGKPQNSVLLLNDGKGNFTSANANNSFFNNIGMVTSASFTDINKDGWQDLVVAGEFMAVKIFVNHKGVFTESEIPQSTGMWQTIYTTDINGDGYPDILAGNWGHNTKLWSGKNGPVKMYIKDFDNNGSVEQILCYTIDGIEYTFLAKDELERPLPVLKKAYLTYSEVAGKSVQYMFYDLFKNFNEVKAETLTSSYFINDGKGNFKRTDLPDDLQLAPVMSFAPMVNQQNNSFIAGGNFYGVTPYEGRYDALYPTIFSLNKQGKAAILPEIDGEVRDMKWIKYTNDQKILVMARNNHKLIFFK